MSHANQIHGPLSCSRTRTILIHRASRIGKATHIRCSEYVAIPLRLHSLLLANIGQAYGKDRSQWATPVMKFHFTTTNLGAGGAATAAQIVMPAYNGNPDTTAAAGTKRDVNLDVNGRFHCTGKFCGALKKAGFSFDEPASPSPSFQMLKVAGSGTEPESPHATIHVLTS